jgi:hypothetical protein
MRSVDEGAGRGRLRRALAYGAVGLAATIGTLVQVSPAQAQPYCPWERICWYGGPMWDYPFKVINGMQAYCTNMPPGWNDTIVGVNNRTTATRFRVFEHQNCKGTYHTYFAQTRDMEGPDPRTGSSFAKLS